MHLTDREKAILDGSEGDIVREALDYIVQFGDAFQAERLVDIQYCHYPAEMAIYEGSVEDLVEYASRGGRVRVPTTTSTLCCDLERPESTGIPKKLAELQSKVESAHRSMGILETYTCKPELLGFTPPFGSYIATVESSAIIYYNSVLGCRTNRGGLFTRYSAITGKYPLMGYMLDENRRGTHLFKVRISPEKLQRYDQWCALGFHIGSIVGSEVPVIVDVPRPSQDCIIGFGAALATSGSVTLFHIPGVTPEARDIGDAFKGLRPKETYEVTEKDMDNVYQKMNTINPGAIDFVTLGCPHYNLEQIRYVAERLKGNKVAKGIRFWINTSRMTRKQAEYSGYMKTIEDAGAMLVADTCPVESHMRISTCRQFGLKVPNVEAMVTDSVKMARYVSDLIGCKTVLTDTDSCINAAISGRWG
jgi:predicted aconitase